MGALTNWIFESESEAETTNGLGEVATLAVLRVLVIDDDPMANRLVERSLSSYAETRTEYSVPEKGAIEWNDFDLVVLDYDLPVRNGLEILGEIREFHPELPILFLTGFEDPSLADRALTAGADIFLTKPTGPAEIQAAFRKLTGHSAGKAFGMGEATEARDSRLRDRSFAAVLEKTGEFLSGEVVRFGFDSAFIEFPSDQDIEEGDRVFGVDFRFGDQRLRSGEAIAGGITSSSRATREVELRIRGGWMIEVVEGVEPGETGKIVTSSKPVARDVAAQLGAERSFLPAEFRLAVHDLAEVLKAVHFETARFESGGEISSVEALRREKEFVETTSEAFADTFWEAVTRFEAAADGISGAVLETAAKAYARRILFPHTLSSPFLSRVVERPIGVPGDYGMLGQILGNPTEGHTIYDRIVNSWILSCGAASAYRHRVWLLHREIVAAAGRASEEQRAAKVLSMASGVAYEIQRVVQDPPPGPGIDFTMVDFSKTTLAEAERQFGLLGEYPEGISVEMTQSSVIDLANWSRKNGRDGAAERALLPSDHDLVYCAGLFDYLSDRLIEKVIVYLHGLLRPGGRLVVSNFSVKNPIRSWMTYVMDWKLIYRSEEEFRDLVARCASDSPFSIETDADGVEIYAILRK